MTKDSILTDCIQSNRLPQELKTKQNIYGNKLDCIDPNIESFCNFDFLKPESIHLTELGTLAVRYLNSDPVTSLEKIGQFAEFLARLVAKKSQLDIRNIDKQYELIQRLQECGSIEAQIYQTFDSIRIKRNNAVHHRLGSTGEAVICLKYAYNLGCWYQQKFVWDYSQYDRPPVSSTSNLSFLQYQKTVTKLENTINNYESLSKQFKNIPDLILDLKNKKKNIYDRIIQLKSNIQQKQEREKHQYEVERQKLFERKRKLELKQIEIEIEISDLQGFDCNSEIRTFLQQATLSRSKIQLELADLDKAMLVVKQKIESTNSYSLDNKHSLKKLLSEYDNLELKIKENLQPKHFEIQIKQQEQEIVLALKNIELIMQKASKENIYLPDLPISILRAVDKYNLY